LNKKISRRKLLAAGTTGLMAGAAASSAHSWSLPFVGGDHLTQWSPPADVTRNLTPGSTPIRLSSAGYQLSNTNGNNPVEQVSYIRSKGYTAAETFFSNWRLMTDSEARELKEELRRQDLWFYNVHVWDNIIHPDPEIRAQTHRNYLAAIEMAEQMDIDFILVHSGSRGYGKPSYADPRNWTSETWQMTVDALKQVLADTAGSRVQLAAEAINSNHLNSPAAHAQLREDVGDERLKVTLDSTNMVNASTLFRSTELLNECFETLGEDILYAHAKDIKWSGMLPGMEWVIPGQGEMDYEVYLTHLSRMEYTRPLMMEFLNRGRGYKGADQYVQAKHFIEETAARLGVTIYS